MISAISALCIILGTYILSKQLFEQTIKRALNIPYNELPLHFRAIIIFFGDKKKFINKSFWLTQNLPLDTRSDEFKILYEPFRGFIFILIGILIQILFKG